MFFNKSKKLLQERELELESALTKLAEYEKEFKEIIDKNSLIAHKESLIQETEKKLQELNETYQKGLILHETLEREISLYQDGLEISSYGLHKPQFSFDT